MRRDGWRIAQLVLGLLVVGLALRQVLANWDAVRTTPFTWKVQPLLLVLSVLVVWAMYALLIATWRLLVERWGGRLTLREAASIWTVSSLGKYVPGKVWAIAGMAVMARRVGVPPWIATGAAVLNQVLAIGAGVVVVALTGTSLLEARYPWLRTAMWILLGVVVIGVFVLSSPDTVRRLLAVAGIDAGDTAGPPLSALLMAGVANVVAWVGYGVALWLMARGLTEVPLPLGLAIGAFAASYLMGFLALVAPAGLGVREGVFILMLDRTMGTPAAVALAVASRLLLTLTELGAAVPFLLSSRERARVAP
ncbi:MAG TPA: lysylphosphatidylglycerol synthase domain-containing protein [Gemmatimonadales bacterium]|nr:lysylphosphatidylglycerol synthase domain-containing protein [Gemmatimonadales bacterium]